MFANESKNMICIDLHWFSIAMCSEQRGFPILQQFFNSSLVQRRMTDLTTKKIPSWAIGWIIELREHLQESRSYLMGKTMFCWCFFPFNQSLDFGETLVAPPGNIGVLMPCTMHHYFDPKQFPPATILGDFNPKTIPSPKIMRKTQESHHPESWVEIYWACLSMIWMIFKEPLKVAGWLEDPENRPLPPFGKIVLQFPSPMTGIVAYMKVSWNGGTLWRDGLHMFYYMKILLNWMIWGYPHLRSF